MNKELNVGEIIKTIRKNKKIMLKDVAKKCNISSSMLSQIEKGYANPSLSTLKSISTALNEPLFKFFIEPYKELPKINILKKEDRKIITTKKIKYELLSPEGTKNIEFMKMIFSKKNSETSNKPMAHKGEEVAVVLKGHVKLIFEDYFEILEIGDSVQIPALTPHKWVNLSDEESVVIFAVTPPEF